MMLGLSVPRALAAPVPSPTPSPRILPSSGTPGSIVKPEPDRSRPKKPRSRSVPASARKIPGGLAKPVRRLVSDLSSGKLSKRDAARLADRMVSDPTSLPKAQRLTKATTEADLMVLGAIVGASLDSSARPSPQRVPAGTLACTVVSGTHQCSYSGSHAAIGYTAEQLSTDEARDADSDGVPDYVKEWANQADDSWDYYRNTLGMTPTSNMVNISINYDLAEIGLDINGGQYLCGSWPDATIRCGGEVPKTHLDWLVPHEMFHQFQWHYLYPTLLTGFPIVIAASLYNINPWMESTANWAASHYAHDVLPTHQTTSGREVAQFPVFYGDVSNGLVASGTSDSGTISGPRAYGAAPVVEFFTQRTSNDFVKESFEALDLPYLDGYSQINDALANEGYLLDDLINPLWLAIYTMCDTHPDSEWWHLQGDIVTSWCSRPASSHRPSHYSASISSPGGTADDLVPGGAGFVDFDLSLGSGGSGVVLSLTFDSDVSLDDVNVWAWKDTPGGETCNVDQTVVDFGLGSTALEFKIPDECGHATLAMVNHGNNLRGSASAYHVTWRGQPAGAVIGNGVLKLGVTADGGLGLGLTVPNDAICRPAAARWAALPPPGVGLVDEAAGFDAIRDDWHQRCRNSDLAEGWSVADPNSIWDGKAETWAHALDGRTSFVMAQVESFQYSSSEATSVVRLDDRYRIVQHWAPSANPRVYRLDVTIQPLGEVGNLPLTYRRVLPLEVDGEGLNFDVTGYSATLSQGNDNVADATNNIFWVYPDDAMGTPDDPTTPLAHYDWSTLTAYGWDDTDTLGFAADINVDAHDNTAGDVQFSLYYGFADSTNDANTALNALNVTTRAVVSVPTTDSGDQVVLIGYRDAD